ncbi:MAG: hypothetical protein WCH79_14275 [Planctomycetia bacterium]
MSADGETRRDGFFGWLFAMLATMSLLPLGITSTNGPSSARPPAAKEAEGAHEDPTNADDPAETTSLDEAILRSLGVWKPTTKGKSKGNSKDPPPPDPLNAILQSLGLPKSPKPSDKSKGPPSPDPLAVIAKLGKKVTIEPLILCVADPETSAVGFRFDLQIDALQKALGADEYVLDQWSLPWMEKKSALGKPGLLVFRKSEKDCIQQNLILVYLVGEWITSGIDREAFRAALLHIKRLEAKAQEATPTKRLPILGPMFTGSVDSLGLALQHDATIWPKRDPVILNYSAMKVDLARLKALSRRFDLPYGETILSTSAMWEGLSEYLDRIYGKKPKVAWLSETGTLFGLKRLHLDRTYYPFPTGISKVRDAYANTTSGESKQKLPVGATDGTILRFPSIDKKADDVLHRFDPGMQAPYAELALRQILLDIARNDYDVVGITATDHRDRVFLAQQVRRYAPRAQLVLLGGDLAYEHPDYRQALRGTIVASTYPMFPTNQQWSVREDSKSRYVFANHTGYALFNAVSAAMVIQRDPDAFDSDSAILTVKEKEKIPFVEYGPPHDDGTSEETPQPQSPPLWISVLGDQGVWPVQSTTLADKQTKLLIKVKSDPLPAQGAGDDRESSMPHDTHDTHPFSLRFILLLQAVAAGLAFWATGGFLPPGRPVAANAEIRAWIQPMREWWSNPALLGHYDSPKARRLFVPMLVGLLALWLQVFVCGIHMWSLFVLNANQSGAWIVVLFPFLIAGAVLLFPMTLPIRLLLGVIFSVVVVLPWLFWGWMFPHSFPGGGVSVGFALLALLAGMLLLRAIVDTVARRRASDRKHAISQFWENVLAVLVISLTAAVMVGVAVFLRLSDTWLPWLTTSSWVFNGVSPLLPLITACLGIEVLCRAELMRCWLIETSFVGRSAGRAGAEGRDTERKEKDELSYPVSGKDVSTLVRQAVHGLLSELMPSISGARTDGEKTSASREPAPHAYLLWIGFWLFVLWLLTLFFHVRPVYPCYWINVAIVSLILFGYLSWGVIFVQLVALRLRFFKQLRAFQHELDAPQSRLAAGFEATRSPRDVWLGRLLYGSQDSVQAGAAAFDSDDSTESAAEDDPADDAARQRAIGIKRWVTFVGTQLLTESAAEGDLAAAADAASRERAIGIKRWVAFVGAQLRITIVGLGFGAILLFVAISSLPFQPRPWFQFTATLSFVAIGIAVVTTYVSVDANEVLSRIAGTTAGKVSFDWALIAKLAPWVVIPLVMVIGQTFPELWNWFGVALESWRGP